MNPSTRAFLESLDISDPLPRIVNIYRTFRNYDTDPITIDVIKSIYTEVINNFYRGLHEYVAKTKRLPINFTDTGKDCDTAASLLEAKAYDETDTEFTEYDYGFDVPIACINTLNNTKTLYSGGYITKSRVIFIILMLLHEIIHIIEYTDSYITSSDNEHTVFFYIVGFQVFGLLSRLSQIIEDNAALKFNVSGHISTLRRLKHDDDLDDGADILNDHSHYMEGDTAHLIGYVTYPKFKNNRTVKYIETGIVGGYRKRKTSRRIKYHKRLTRKSQR